jgi:hypothetical protein
LLEFAPSAFAPALALCTTLEGVLEVQTYGDKVHVFVDDVARRKPQIQAALATQGVLCEGLREIDVRMEEAFISLIHRKTHGGGPVPIAQPSDRAPGALP